MLQSDFVDEECMEIILYRLTFNSRKYNTKNIHMFQNTESLQRILLFCAILYNMEAKSSAQMGHIRCFFDPMLANCVHTKNYVGQNVHVSERQILFSPNCRKFAIEYD